jgi:hypothetical protein
MDTAVAPDGAASETSPADATQVNSWSTDFSVKVVDPAQDDTGDGDYLYPAGVSAGSADLRSFSLAYSAQTGALEVEIGLTSISESTRVGLVLMDETAFKGAQRDWTVGGAEIRVPLWNKHGVSFVVSLPQSKSALFDYNVSHANPAGDPRPDNVFYVHHDPTQWLDLYGVPTQTTASLRRLNVTVDTAAAPQTLAFAFQAKDLASYIDLDTPRLYAVLFAYLVVDTSAKKYAGLMEYGAYDVATADGATDGWEDCDAFDIGFVDPGVDQGKLLTVTGQGVGAVVELDTLGKGVLEIDTSKTSP